MHTPDIGTHRRADPEGGMSTRAVAHAAIAGATIGSVMWFDDDMVVALRGGARRDGWSGTVRGDGTTIIALDALGINARWELTGTTRPNPSTPGRVVHEGVWPD